MLITALPQSGNSSKFQVVTKRGGFNLAMSFTLRTKIWKLAGPEAELAVAQELAEAVVSRHDPDQPFKTLYIFAEHNTRPTPAETVQHIRKYGKDN